MLNKRVITCLDELIRRYPELESVKSSIIDAYRIIVESYNQDGKLLIAGNGGSAADAEHIVGELMKSFRISRKIPKELENELCNIDATRGKELAENLERGLMAIPLVTHEALSTAYINDVNGKDVFAQQLYGYGRKGDVFLGISTSGNSENVLLAAITAKALGIKVIALTGARGGRLADIADITINAPEIETYKIQELHLPIYHCLCMMLEEYYFGEE